MKIGQRFSHPRIHSSKPRPKRQDINKILGIFSVSLFSGNIDSVAMFGKLMRCKESPSMLMTSFDSKILTECSYADSLPDERLTLFRKLCVLELSAHVSKVEVFPLVEVLKRLHVVMLYLS